MELSKEKRAILSLLSLPEIGPRRYKIILEAFGSIADFLAGLPPCLSEGPSNFTAFLNDAKLIKLRDRANAFDLEAFIAFNQKNSINIVACIDDNYPQRLKDIEGYPPVIYVKGSLEESDIFALAIVGTRHPTNYGSSACKKIAKEVSACGIAIVSGLARGIDTAAHVSALSEKGRTIAVLGNSLECYYPPENKKLQDEISEKGALVSEFPIGTRPDKANFPRRNRLISALSQGVLVVEAGTKSGSLITAKFAAEQGKEVFAVPGSIFSKYSEGTNYLISHGAAVVQKAADIIENVSCFSEKFSLHNKNDVMPVLSADESKIIKLLSDNEEGLIHDEIAEALDVASENLSACLVELEIKGLIKNLPGAKYVRNYN